ncbi:MAG: hypothetical protein ACLS8T_35845 [Anaerobutyricum sp.]
MIWKQSISSDVRTAGWVVLQKGTMAVQLAQEHIEGTDLTYVII